MAVWQMSRLRVKQICLLSICWRAGSGWNSPWRQRCWQMPILCSASPASMEAQIGSPHCLDTRGRVRVVAPFSCLTEARECGQHCPAPWLGQVGTDSPLLPPRAVLGTQTRPPPAAVWKPALCTVRTCSGCLCEACEHAPSPHSPAA